VGNWNVLDSKPSVFLNLSSNTLQTHWTTLLQNLKVTWITNYPNTSDSLKALTQIDFKGRFLTVFQTFRFFLKWSQVLSLQRTYIAFNPHFQPSFDLAILYIPAFQVSLLFESGHELSKRLKSFFKPLSRCRFYFSTFSWIFFHQAQRRLQISEEKTQCRKKISLPP
jgi:hypothetical protein